MDEIVKKKPTDDIEDAEILTSNYMKHDWKHFFSIKIQLLVFCIIGIAFVCITFASLFYYEKKLSAEIVKIKNKLDSLPSIVSLETIESKLGEFKSSERSASTKHIDEVIYNIQNELTEKVDSMFSFTQETKIKVIEEDISKLKLKLNETITSLNTIPYEKDNDLEPADYMRLTNHLTALETSLNDKEGSSLKKIKKLEQEVANLNERLFELNRLITIDIDKRSFVDFESLNALRESFPEIAIAALKLETKTNSGKSAWGRFVSTINSIFIFRSTSPRQGFDTDAILSRAEYELGRGNFEECLKELSVLDESVAGLFTDWKNNLTKLIKKPN